MKRKRGHKQSKSNAGISEASTVEPGTNTEASSGSESCHDEDNAESDAGVGTEMQSPAGMERLDNSANTKPEGVIQRPPPMAVYGRVKVKLKTSRPLESQVTSCDAPMHSDADKSSQQVSVNAQIHVPEKVEDSGNSFPETENAGLENSSRKAGSIKIKSSKPLLSPCVNQSTSTELSADERPDQQESRLPHQDHRYSKRELDAALEVIRKVMRMDAAEPFNVPVNPIALGIPDYFDVIDTPMDFGTICANLESGNKYKNSENVYRDVQYIWENCFKYNSKGDYIVDLMKRVKKNFMKYWTAAELYTDHAKKTNGIESSTTDSAKPSNHGKKLKRGKGVKRHKDDCLCAICIMKRRRREREAREAGAQAGQAQFGVAETSLHQEPKQEDNSQLESPSHEDTSSYMGTSPDMNADTEDTGEGLRSETIDPPNNGEQRRYENRVEFHDKGDISREIPEKSQRSCYSENGFYARTEAGMPDESGDKMKVDEQKQLSTQLDVQTQLYHKQKLELLEAERRRQRLRLYENFRHLETPTLLALCGSLFSTDQKAVWSGPHSLVRLQRPQARSDIHDAVSSLMEPTTRSVPSLTKDRSSLTSQLR